MPMDFHAESNRFSYANRQADPMWLATIQKIVDLHNKRIVDIGCGGGIYAKALLEMGATSVDCIDFSEESLKGARENCRDCTSIHFVVADALNMGLAAEQYDVILERALIHHLGRNNVETCFKEAFRLLKVGGILIVQDRTPGDCLLPGSHMNIRGYFFSRYPKLIDKEIARRLESEFVVSALQDAGFSYIERRKLWETRKIYADLHALEDDLLARTGRSILHDLTDTELHDLVAFIKEQLHVMDGQEIIEQDRWTIWSAQKGAK